jgi:prolyl 4-hydroxylase
MHLFDSCRPFFKGTLFLQDDAEELRVQPEDHEWRCIQTHAGEVIHMCPEHADIIDPLDYPDDEATLVHADPAITVIPGFLTDDEVAHLVDVTRGRWKHSRVGAAEGDYSEGKESDVRTSMSCTLRRGETATIRHIEDRVCELARIDRTYLENLAPVRYLPGQQYRPHHDGSARPITVFIYLSDLPEDAEGETYFPVLNMKIRPRKGSAVVWANPKNVNRGECKANEDSRLLHAALPCKAGIKLGLNCFFSIYPQNDEEQKSRVVAVGAPAASVPDPRVSFFPARNTQYPAITLSQQAFNRREAGQTPSLHMCAASYGSRVPLGTVACH